MCSAYANFILKSLCFAVQPLRIFNSSVQTFVDYAPEYCVVQQRKAWHADKFVRYHGQLNYALLFIYIAVRFLVLASHLVWVYFSDLVSFARVCAFMGVELDSLLMMKTLFH